MSKEIKALKMALSTLANARDWVGNDPEGRWDEDEMYDELCNMVKFVSEALADSALERMAENARELGLDYEPAQQQEPVTVLPDGSAFAVMSYPLPKDHWLYADRQYNDGEYEPVELGKPVLTHELRDAVVSAVRYAIRAATNCGKEVDFDPDALVQNAVYALCGPFTSPPASKPLTDEQRKAIVVCFTSGKVSVSEVQRKLAISYNEAQQLCQSIVDLGLAQGLQLAPSLDRHGIKGDA